MRLFGRNRKKTRKNTVGLVLGGGGARGFVQVGALKAFREAGIEFDIVTGTSAGSIVGALYAAGIAPDAIEAAAEKTEFSDLHGKILIKPDDPRKIGKIVQGLIGDVDIETLPKKFAAVATDLKTGKQIVLDRGPVLDAVSASSAYPIAYSPLERDGMNLCDGGLVNNIPADVARMLGADKIVTVDAHGTRGSGTDGKGFLDMLKAMFSIMSANASTLGLMQSDIVIAPDTSAYSASKKTGYTEMIELGYNAAKQRLDEIKKLFLSDEK